MTHAERPLRVVGASRTLTGGSASLGELAVDLADGLATRPASRDERAGLVGVDG